jgi:signal transduction histidine kinase/CheY-like chemotaxis protein
LKVGVKKSDLYLVPTFHFSGRKHNTTKIEIPKKVANPNGLYLLVLVTQRLVLMLRAPPLPPQTRQAMLLRVGLPFVASPFGWIIAFVLVHAYSGTTNSVLALFAVFVITGLCLGAILLAFDPDLLPGNLRGTGGQRCRFGRAGVGDVVVSGDVYERAMFFLWCHFRTLLGTSGRPLLSLEMSSQIFIILLFSTILLGFVICGCTSQLLMTLVSVVGAAAVLLGVRGLAFWLAVVLVCRSVLPLMLAHWELTSICYESRVCTVRPWLSAGVQIAATLSMAQSCQQLLRLMTCVHERLEAWMPVVLELRRPLHGFFAAVSELEDEFQTAPDVTPREVEAMKTLHQCARVLQSVADSSLADPTEPSTVLTDVPELVASLAAILRSSDDHRVTVQDVDAPLGVVLFPRAAAIQAVTNIIGNAHKYTRPGGAIDLIVRVVLPTDDQSEAMLEFAVEDTGPGVPKSERTAVFDPMVRLDSDTTASSAGLGLGIVRQLCDDHGGEYWCSGRTDSKRGARFVIRLPFSRGNDSFPEKLSRPTSSVLVHGAALAIDDNPLNLAVVSRFLTQLGASPVYECSSYADVVNLLEKGVPVRFAVIDFSLPGDMDGCDVVQAIRSRQAGERSPIIIGASASVEVARAQFAAVGVHEVVSKPFDKATLARALSRSTAASAAAGSAAKLESALAHRTMITPSQEKAKEFIRGDLWRIFLWSTTIAASFRLAVVVFLGFPLFELVRVGVALACFTTLRVYVVPSRMATRALLLVISIFPALRVLVQGCTGNTGMVMSVVASSFLAGPSTASRHLLFAIVVPVVFAILSTNDLCPGADSGEIEHAVIDMIVFALCGGFTYPTLVLRHTQFVERQSLMSTLRWAPSQIR